MPTKRLPKSGKGGILCEYGEKREFSLRNVINITMSNSMEALTDAMKELVEFMLEDVLWQGNQHRLIPVARTKILSWYPELQHVEYSDFKTSMRNVGTDEDSRNLAIEAFVADMANRLGYDVVELTPVRLKY